jgi:hypothetical protein
MPNKCYLIIQQGGSSKELYVHAHATLEEARDDIESCKEAAYNTTVPIYIPTKLWKAVEQGKSQEELFTLIEAILKQSADL